MGKSSPSRTLHGGFWQGKSSMNGMIFQPAIFDETRLGLPGSTLPGAGAHPRAAAVPSASRPSGCPSAGGDRADWKMGGGRME